MTLFNIHNIELDGGQLLFIDNWLTSSEADNYFTQFKSSLAWQRYQIKLFGKSHWSPRLTAFYGEPNLDYRYSNLTLTTKPWTPQLRALKDRLFNEFHNHASYSYNCDFNSVLCNYYRDQQDAMGWHADNEPELGAKPVIASVNFGDTREFKLKHNLTKQQYSLPLSHGSLLIMAGDTQHNWQHAIHRSKQQIGPRINLTFRRIL